MIIENKKSYRETSKILKISLSTLKLIVSRFEETGTVFKSKSELKNDKLFMELKEESEISQEKLEFHQIQMGNADYFNYFEPYESMWVWFPFYYVSL